MKSIEKSLQMVERHLMSFPGFAQAVKSKPDGGKAFLRQRARTVLSDHNSGKKRITDIMVASQLDKLFSDFCVLQK